MEKVLLLMVGPQGSGKTTLSVDKYSDYYRISQDDMGKQRHWQEFNRVIEKGIDKVLIDRMNFNKSQRMKYIIPAKAKGYKINVILFDIPKDVCLNRIKRRGGHPTLKVENAEEALGFYFRNYERPESEEGIDSIEEIKL